MFTASRAGGFFLLSSNLTFLPGAGIARSLTGAFLSLPTLASTLPTFTFPGKAAFDLCPSGLQSMTLLTNSNSWIIVRLFWLNTNSLQCVRRTFL